MIIKNHPLYIKHSAGFTLIELLIAISIFAVLAVMSYQAIDTTITSNNVAEERLDRLSKLNRLFSLMSRDLLQSINRPIRDEAGSLTSGLYSPDSAASLEFTHQGRVIAIDPFQTTLQRTRYRLQTGKLYRDNWLVLDRAPDSKPKTRLLLDGIDNIRFEFIDIDSQTYNHWPYFNSGIAAEVTYLPVGVRVTLETQYFGAITRTFVMGGA